MALCEVVAAAAEAVANARQPLTPKEMVFVHLLRGMPFYRDWRRLDLWEQACNHLADDDPSLETERLLNDVYWLGFENLYGAFQEPVTQEIYQSLVKNFADTGIELPKDPDLSGW
jgi:hypothetical protein